MWITGGSYEIWAEFLERWAAGDQLNPRDLPPLTPADLPGDTWERLARRLGSAMSERLEGWGKGLTRGIGEARNEFEVGRALASARDGLRSIRALAAYSGVPEELRKALLESVDRQIHQAQHTLESQVQSERRRGAPASAVEARLRTLRENRLTVVIDEVADSGTPADRERTAWTANPGAAPRRRIALD